MYKKSSYILYIRTLSEYLSLLKVNSPEVEEEQYKKL